MPDARLEFQDESTKKWKVPNRFIFERLASHRTRSTLVRGRLNAIHGKYRRHISLADFRKSKRLILNHCLHQFQEKIILLTVTGIFREKQMASTSRSEPLLRSFHRSLVITKKVGGGFCIINDMLHVNNLTMAQVKTAFKPIAPVPVTTGPVQAPVVPTPTSALAAPTALDDTTKLRMIQEMANGSQMNLEWSKL